MLIREGCEVKESGGRGGTRDRCCERRGEGFSRKRAGGDSVWGTPQLARLGIKVPVRPHIAQMAFFHVPAGSGQRLQTTCSIREPASTCAPRAWLRCSLDGRKKGFHDPDEPAIDPDDYKQTAEYAPVRQMHAGLSVTLPSMRDGFVHRTYACTYDVTPDEMPILERLMETTGCSLPWVQWWWLLSRSLGGAANGRLHHLG
ncbi:MAG: hypothetical protein Ct9H300mP1_06000 [Planctomycetaceae bacterium]|nr:MAG: hypothetical protein Ct9H300mP1_06000 [Planctomycetaceae bacterium]